MWAKSRECLASNSSKIPLNKKCCPSYFEESEAWKGIVVGL